MKRPTSEYGVVGLSTLPCWKQSKSHRDPIAALISKIWASKYRQTMTCCLQVRVNDETERQQHDRPISEPAKDYREARRNSSWLHSRQYTRACDYRQSAACREHFD
nr:hypothetical protein CFP56_77978 [Quercus suber]